MPVVFAGRVLVVFIIKLLFMPTHHISSLVDGMDMVLNQSLLVSMAHHTSGTKLVNSMKEDMDTMQFT